MRPETACVRNGQICDNFSKYPKRCDICVNESYFNAKKNKPSSTGLRKYKKSSRMGARFEEDLNYKLNKLVESASSLTPNSGAGMIKGDIELDGLATVMGELKTKVVPRISRGSLSFVILREWLDKVKNESKDANKEFWFLAFRFLENNEDTYIVFDEKELEKWIYTLVRDRKIALVADSEVEAYKDRYRALEASIVALEAKNKALQSKIDYYEKILDPDKIIK